ncbi:MAG: hypothetical protein V4655_09740 [Bdellovibrionota bacterium]
MRNLLLLAVLTLIAGCTKDSQYEKAPESTDHNPEVSIGNDFPQQDSKQQTPTRPSEIKLGLNDVSILIPYFKHPALFKTMPSFLDYFPSSHLKALDNTLRSDNETADQNTTLARIGTDQSYFDYRLVSIRFDPCANVLSPMTTPSCEAEIRLVWQRAVKASDTDYFFDDNVIHTIHAVASEEFTAIVKQLRVLKGNAKHETYDLPLLPSPTIEKEGPNSSYLKGLLSLVKANTKNLIGIAYFANTSKTLGNWPMFRLDRSGESLYETDIPVAHAKIQRMTGRSFLSKPMPLGITADANALENPRLHSTLDTDCASCHRANNETNKGLGQYENSNFDLTARFATGSKVSLQMFSYFDQQIKITPRVINTSAEICDYINSGKF